MVTPPIAPRLYPWGPRTLYLGPSQKLSPHRNAVACLAIGLESEFGVAENPQVASAAMTNEDQISAALMALWREDIAWRETRETLQRLLLGVTRETDSRIKVALQQIAADPTGRLSAAELARDAGLSESRFLHLFAEATGVPLRRYRLWCAMGAALRAIAQGDSLTAAALDAGFSSSAHFSAAFREMFGMAPSQLSRTGIQVLQPLSESATPTRDG